MQEVMGKCKDNARKIVKLEGEREIFKKEITEQGTIEIG